MMEYEGNHLKSYLKNYINCNNSSLIYFHQKEFEVLSEVVVVFYDA